METNQNDPSIANRPKTIFIKRTLNLPLQTVWRAFSEEESFKKWYGPEGYSCPHSSIDFRVGGKYLNSMQGPDGKEIWGTGTFKEIIPLNKIVYTDSFSDSKGNVVHASEYNMPGDWELELKVTLEFEEADNKTRLFLTHEGIPPEAYDDCIKGWQQCLDKLECNLA
jgi:uncharacterized protein YndB with AHSA1/START domain